MDSGRASSASGATQLPPLDAARVLQQVNHKNALAQTPCGIPSPDDAPRSHSAVMRAELRPCRMAGSGRAGPCQKADQAAFHGEGIRGGDPLEA